MIDLRQSTLYAIQGWRDLLVQHFVKILYWLSLSGLSRLLVLGCYPVGFPDMLKLLVEVVQSRLAFRFDVLHCFHLTQSRLCRWKRILIRSLEWATHWACRHHWLIGEPHAFLLLEPWVFSLFRSLLTLLILKKSRLCTCCFLWLRPFVWSSSFSFIGHDLLFGAH